MNRPTHSIDTFTARHLVAAAAFAAAASAATTIISY
jgi:hypothetical protein